MNTNKIANIIAQIIAPIIFIAYYLTSKTVLLLIRFWRVEFKLAILLFALNCTLPVLTNVVYAPKSIYAVYESPKTEHEKIINEIIRVFGKDSDKAFKLLTDPKCHENGKLNPLAVNDNTTWGGVGRDIGVFQISTVYQRVQEKFLYNYVTNIQIAHDLYVENHNHFNLWTCGKVLGI
jgi:hypothetical protein